MSELWTKNSGLVRQTVHKLTGLNDSEDGFEDMAQQAYFGFHAAAYSFDPSAGTKFSTYAVRRIKWELCRYYERNGYTTRIPAFMRARLKRGAGKIQELEAETGQAVPMEAALQALGYSNPTVIAGTMAAYKKLWTDSLDAEVYTGSGGDSIPLIDCLADGVDVETGVLEEVWHRELHDLLCKALQELPENVRAVIIRQYFNGVPLDMIARENGVTVQAVWKWKSAGFQKIRAGKYGADLAEFCETVSKKERAERMIQRDREAVKRLQLSDDEMGLMAL